MRLETFFDKFDLFADAPDAVVKMRELVLQLAVRGELVPQDARDEPASKALETIIPANGLRRDSSNSEKADTSDLPFVVPSSWSWVRFGDLVRIRTGKLDANAAVDGGAYPFFTCSKTPSRIATYSFDTSAVILAGNGDFNLKSYVGKFDAYQRTYVIEPLGWELGFCFWLVSAQIKRITNNQRGSAIPYLRLGDIADPLVPFPPLAEQKRIVAKVDELMALCDRLEVQQQKRETQHTALARASLARFADAPTPAKLDLLFHKSYSISPADLRKSILTLAVQGKLVPQDPNDEPAESSLPNFSKVAVEAQDDLFPRHWLRVPLGDVGEWYGGGTPSKSRPDFWKGDMPWISPKDMKTLRITDAQDHISQAAIEGSSVRLVPTGSILMVVRGMILARAFPVALTEREVTINQDMKALVPSDTKAAEFLLLALRAFEPDVLAAIERSSHGTCKLRTDVLESFQIPIPPLAEQRQIVAKVDELMELVDALESQLATARITVEKLMEAVVAELTTQD